MRKFITFLNRVKSALAKAVKLLFRFLLALLILISSVAFFVVPFLSKHLDLSLAQWIWYPALIISIISSAWGVFKQSWFKNKEPIITLIGKVSYICIFPIVSSIFVFNYYDIVRIWLWVIFAFAAVYILIFFLSLLGFYIKANPNEKKEQQQKVSLRLCKYILFYWLCDLFYMSFIIDSLICKYIFGGLIMVIIFYNLVSAFLNGKEDKSGVFKYALIQDFIIGVGVSIYLVFIIPNTELQTIVTAIVAALYGGLFTLVGVAWTIRDSNQKRQEDIDRVEEERRVDLERINEERREDERKKYRPLVNYYVGEYIAPHTVIEVVNWLMHNENISSVATEKLNCSNHISNCYFANTDFSHFFIWGLKLNDEYFKFSSVRLIRKDTAFLLDFNKCPLYTKEKVTSISLILEDVLENYYELKLSIEVSTLHGYAIRVKGNDLPVLLKNFDKEKNNE